MEITLAYSPCPNDTYLFSAIRSGLLTLGGSRLNVHHHDIETLNRYALEGRYQVTKMSFYTWLLVKNNYRLLRAGNAMGYGCGPVLISRKPIRPEDLPDLKIVLPGEHTSAHLLFRLFAPKAANRVFAAYDRIFETLNAGAADCGVVIHESRFTFEREGFIKVRDLGDWWETQTRSPVPLGAVAVRSDLDASLDPALEDLIRRSLGVSRADPASAMPYIREMARETDDSVIRKHIEMFVNHFTSDPGEDGLRAVELLQKMAGEAGLTG